MMSRYQRYQVALFGSFARHTRFNVSRAMRRKDSMDGVGSHTVSSSLDSVPYTSVSGSGCRSMSKMVRGIAQKLMVDLHQKSSSVRLQFAAPAKSIIRGKLGARTNKLKSSKSTQEV